MGARFTWFTVLAINSQTKVYFARDPLDMRKQIDGISLAVQELLQLDPFSLHAFVFCNKQRNKLKVLYWQGNGFCLLYKRLEKGRFPWPKKETIALQYHLRELQWLLEGHDIAQLPALHTLSITRI